MILPTQDGRYERRWTDRFGKPRFRVVMVIGRRMLATVEAAWTDVPADAGGSWTFLGPMDERLAMYGEDPVGDMADEPRIKPG